MMVSKVLVLASLIQGIYCIPYDSPSSVQFQIGIGAPKRHLFYRQPESDKKRVEVVWPK